MTADWPTVRALAMHAALTTGGPIGAVERAQRYERLIAEYAESGDCAELREATEEARSESCGDGFFSLAP